MTTNDDEPMTADEKRRLAEEVMHAMTKGDGIHFQPYIVTVGHGYDDESDLILFGGMDEASRILLTFQLTIEQAREALQHLAAQVELVDRLNAAARDEDNDQ